MATLYDTGEKLIGIPVFIDPEIPAGTGRLVISKDLFDKIWRDNEERTVKYRRPAPPHKEESGK